MIKNVFEIEVKIEDGSYRFIFNSGSHINNIKESLFQIQKMVSNLEDQLKAQLEAQNNQKEEKEDLENNQNNV